MPGHFDQLDVGWGDMNYLDIFVSKGGERLRCALQDTEPSTERD